MKIDERRMHIWDGISMTAGYMASAEMAADEGHCFRQV